MKAETLKILKLAKAKPALVKRYTKLKTDTLTANRKFWISELTKTQPEWGQMLVIDKITTVDQLGPALMLEYVKSDILPYLNTVK